MLAFQLRWSPTYMGSTPGHKLYDQSRAHVFFGEKHELFCTYLAC